MSKPIRLDVDRIDVSTFDVVAPRASAAMASDTTDEWCMAMTLLAEDCFGPTAGCTPGSEECVTEQLRQAA
jgi:hypothetical protein